ncbi:MAG TPA: nucleotidyltransferase family protein [Paenibacillus sp.]|uniref:nucleotidyltransferase family protein n=1 Tax=Paenibacillus sp. TaxID=58172 RepID=UPI0028D7B78F|nr:nucleotidyltransferase family protein [Paenibacillus sp.]HUC91615.1 nucleotidyltransferase family protein [Paenibacillus sp.]
MNGIGAVILAAGQARRFGGGKQLAPLSGKPLFLYPVELAVRTGLSRIVLVANDRTAAGMSAYIADKPVKLVLNADAEQGMSTSLRAGIRAVKEHTRAAFVFLADQPFVPDEAVPRLIERYDDGYGKGIRIVRASYAGRPGHPVLFDRDMYALIDGLQGDEGARSVLEAHRASTATVDFAAAEWNEDIDTVEDYHRAERYCKKRNDRRQP